MEISCELMACKIKVLKILRTNHCHISGSQSVKHRHHRNSMLLLSPGFYLLFMVSLDLAVYLFL